MKNIFSLFKKGFGIETSPELKEAPVAAKAKETGLLMPSSPVLRESVIGFIVQTLQPYVDEKAISLAGLHFYMVCNSRQQEEAARVALYMDRPGMFKTEHLERKLLNHFIQLDPAWFFECQLVKEPQLPEQCIRKENFGLTIVRSGEPVAGPCTKAVLQVLSGQAAQTEYVLNPQQQLKFCVGRTRNPQLRSGKIQHNDIVFLGSEETGFNEIKGSANLHVSRNHAYFVYEPKTGNWLLYPDTGGLPESGNKLKVHTVNDKVKWLNIYGISHRLCEGDQIELGGQAVLRFLTIQS